MTRRLLKPSCALKEAPRRAAPVTATILVGCLTHDPEVEGEVG